MRLLYILTVLLILAVSCKKDAKIEDKPSFKLEVITSYSIDSSALVFDSLMYTNAAGNIYSISKLEYYISKLILHKTSGDLTYDQVWYINAEGTLFNGFEAGEIPSGDYTGISFLIGLDSTHNISNALPATIQNNSMYWPPSMGGGYHFMKLEGNYQDSLAEKGFAMHLGRNSSLVQVYIPGNFSVSSSGVLLELKMNINSWFTTPAEYNFLKDGPYTMSSEALMRKLADNGRDAFTFKLIP